MSRLRWWAAFIGILAVSAVPVNLLGLGYYCRMEAWNGIVDRFPDVGSVTLIYRTPWLGCDGMVTTLGGKEQFVGTPIADWVVAFLAIAILCLVAVIAISSRVKNSA